MALKGVIFDGCVWWLSNYVKKKSNKKSGNKNKCKSENNISSNSCLNEFKMEILEMIPVLWTSLSERIPPLKQTWASFI